MHEPTIAEKFEFLVSTEIDYTPEDLKKSAKARKDVARSIAIFSAFAEGVSLYSSFAVLYSFQMRNLLKGVGQQMKWSVRDESLHSKMGCQLFRHLCEEYPELRDEVEYDVVYAAKLMVDMEHNFINKMFEMGDLENLKAEDLRNFILRRANEKLVELGYEPKFEFNSHSADQLEWFYHLTGGTTHTDFFAIRPTDYAKAGEDENWDEDDIF
jgi:ribonucleoside-diphosphate reductase beta chain